MNCSTPDLPVHHQLPEFTQTHVHRVGDAIQLSYWDGNRQEGQGSPNGGNSLQVSDIFISLKHLLLLLLSHFSRVQLFATPWTAARQASLFTINSRSLPKLMSIELVMPSNHLLLAPSPPALNLSQHQGLFQWVSSLHQVAKVLEFQLQYQSFQWTPRTDHL